MRGRMKLKKFDTFEEFVKHHDGVMLKPRGHEIYYVKMLGGFHHIFKKGDQISGDLMSIRIYQAFLDGKVFKQGEKNEKT